MAMSRILPSNSTTILAQLPLVDLSPHLSYDMRAAEALGGFCDIFRGFHTENGNGERKSVAIKRLRVNATEWRRLFECEVYVWAKLLHENVLPLIGFAFCPITGSPLLISQWMDHGSAWTYIKRHPELSLKQIRDLIKDIAHGLSYLHEQNIIHSDIKADNVVVSPEGRAMICDFGCTRMEIASLSMMAVTSTEKGTRHFWAPELCGDAEGHVAKHSKETDVWAFGMTVYEIVSHKRPYHGLNQMQVLLSIFHGKFPVIGSIPWSTSPEDLTPRLFKDLCQECLVLGPSDRPSMQQIVTRRVLIEPMPIMELS